jgi:hypothetical protein
VGVQDFALARAIEAAHGTSAAASQQTESRNSGVTRTAELLVRLQTYTKRVRTAVLPGSWFEGMAPAADYRSARKPVRTSLWALRANNS